MSHRAFDELVRDVPDRVRLSPRTAWAEARRRRRRRRGAVLVAAVAVAVGAAAGFRALGDTSHVEPAPSPGATFVRADRVGSHWEVLRSNGTRLTLDPQIDFTGPTLGISPDGRWLSYALGPEEGSLLDLYVLRSDETEVVRAPEVAATYGDQHLWSPDGRVVLVPVADGDFNIVDTEGDVLVHDYVPGATAGFTDDDSLGWVRSEGRRGDQGLTWMETTTTMAEERSLSLEVDRATLNPDGWAQLMVRQAVLSPDRSRVATLLTDHRDRGWLLVFDLEDGALLDRRDATGVDRYCPLRWDAGDVVGTPQGEPCVVVPR